VRGDGRVFQRGSSWWIQFQARGEQHREPARLPDKDGILQPAKKATEAKRALRIRRAEILGGRFIGRPEKVTVKELLDDYVTHQENAGLRSLRTLKLHLVPVRATFDSWHVVELTTAALGTYQRGRRDEGKAPATINRELELLRAALRYASRQTPPKLPAHLVPTVPMLPVENARTGFFTAAEIKALLEQLDDADVRDFIEWAFRTGMRRGEIAKLEWSMLDQSGEPWVLRIPGTITKNAKGRSFGFDGEALAVMRRRLQARRLDCPLIFHREGRAMGPFRDLWRSAVKAAGLPSGRLFHDLRRSAVRNLIRSGVDQTTAMKVSGHLTDSTFRRYNIVEESETAAALRRADAWLSSQPLTRNVVVAGAREKRDSSGTVAHSRPLRIQQGSEDGWCRRWDLNPH
jgi:integrase